jgi:hypothetical protein
MYSLGRQSLPRFALSIVMGIGRMHDGEEFSEALRDHGRYSSWNSGRFPKNILGTKSNRQFEGIRLFR